MIAACAPCMAGTLKVGATALAATWIFKSKR